MDPRPIGVNLFSVRRQLIEDFEGTLGRIAAMGYAGVEPMVFGPMPLDVLPEDMRVPTPDGATFRALLDHLGLATTSLHAPLPEGDVADWSLDFAEALGTDQLVLASWIALPDAANAHTDAALIPKVAQRFDTACELAAKRGLRVGFHNHHFEWEHDLGGRNAWDLFWEAVDARVVAELDVYWAATTSRTARPCSASRRSRSARAWSTSRPAPAPRSTPTG
jgi:sugar phosphate isomerase/epimerase